MIATPTTRQLGLFADLGAAEARRRSRRGLAMRQRKSSATGGPGAPLSAAPRGVKIYGRRGGRPVGQAMEEKPRRVVRETSKRPSGPDAEQMRLLNAMRANPSGLTDQQLEEICLMNGSSERPRRRELEKLGLVRDSGQRRPVRSGRQAIVWIAIDNATT